MATKTLKSRLELDGAAEYKRQLAEINSGHKLLASEMRQVNEQYKGNEQSAEALTAKSRILENQLLQQRDKIAILNKALVETGQKYGEADSRTYSYKIQLTNAQTEEIKLQRALDDTNKSLQNQGQATEETGKKMVGLGDQLSDITDKFGVHLPAGVTKALNHVDGFSKGTVAAMGAAAAGIGAVKLAIDGISAGIKAAQALMDMTLEQGKWADDLLTRSAQTGLDTTLLQQLDYASNFLDFDGIDKSLVKLTASMDSARDGAEKQTAAFEALGVSVVNTDGTLRDNWETFLEVIDALGQVENATERDTLANDIFGKSYSELKPLIDAGSEGLEEFMQKAVDTGAVLDESQVKKLGEVDDAYQEYQQQIEATKKKLAVEFAPVAVEAMSKFAEWVEKAGTSLAESGIIENLSAFLEPLGKILGIGLELINDVLPVITPMVNALADAVSWLADLVDRAVNGIKELPWNWLERRMDTVYDPSSNAWNASGTDYWRGGLTWVGEGGPELVELPRGSRIHSNQESMQLIGSGTDTSRIELLLGEAVGMLRQLHGDVGYIEDRRRMI